MLERQDSYGSASIAQGLSKPEGIEQSPARHSYVGKEQQQAFAVELRCLDGARQINVGINPRARTITERVTLNSFKFVTPADHPLFR